MIAAVAMSFSAMAQEQPQNDQRRQFNPEEMAKNRTEEAVKKYGLNEEQAAKLLDLNKRFSDKMRPMRNMRQGRICVPVWRKCARCRMSTTRS